MVAFGWAVVYLAFHFLLYALLLRRRRLFTRERTILVYHIVGALGLTGALAARIVVAPQPGDGAIAVGVVALQGIYSLSFLELWSLAEGSYSLAILERVDRGPDAATPEGLSDLSRIGTRKRQGRLDDLQRLRLVRPRGDRIELTGLGRLISGGLRLIGWVARMGPSA
ncbi:MAG: hypothetical protein ACRELS_01830 [Candidatus Rokuibacteriota bacterium]